MRLPWGGAPFEQCMLTLHPTPIGTLIIEATPIGLARCSWTMPDFRLPATPEDPIMRNFLGMARRQIDEYFCGVRRRFELPLALEGTEFQRRVWQSIMEIPYGQTVSYSRLAELCGCAGAQRAVAGACGRNRLALIIPCHRVTAAGGALGGYSANSPIAPPPPNPLEIKRRLLEYESRR